MFIRVLKECRCTLSYWHDRHWGDRWKNDAWEKRERQETLKAGQLIKAVRVRPSDNHQDHCHINTSLGDMPEGYLNVPWNCIEIVEGDPE
ncbi:MAG: hypothetical protein KKA54_04825 [Proteobacteria bacterium]|nr:hypothetical protein [Pseudomonadota bacterium]